MATADLRPLTVGEILDVAFGLYRRLFAPLIVVQVLCSALPFLLEIYVTASGGPAAKLVLYILGVFLRTVLSALASVACVLVISEYYLGRPMRPGEALSRAQPYIWQVIVLSILVTFAIGVGFLLLIVPGLILLCGLAVVTQTLVLEGERSATTAMSRSWELTKGFRLRMFGLIVAAICLVFVPVMGFGVVGGIITGTESADTAQFDLMTTIVAGLVTIVIYPLIYCILTVAYYDLRVRKEAFDLQMLSQALQKA